MTTAECTPAEARALRERFSRKFRLDKPALFRHVGYEPHTGQLPIHESEAPRRIVDCGVRFGKSLCAGMEAVAAAMEPRPESRGWIVAPTYSLCEKVFREVVRVFYERMRHRVIQARSKDMLLRIRNLAGGVSEIQGKSADNPVGLLGEALDWLVVDEMARVKPEVWDSYLSQRLIDRKGWAMMISTPKGYGLFYDLWRRGQNGADPEYESWQRPSWVNPHLDRRLIERERDRLPERVFRQEYGAEFLEGAGAVFRNVRGCASGEWREPRAGASYLAGLDLAKTTDWTVLVIIEEGEQPRVVHVERFQRVDWRIQCNRIKAALERYQGCPVVVDATGVGDPVLEALLTADIPAEPFKITAGSKSDLVNNLALLIERKRLVLPRYELWSEGIEELESFQYSVNESTRHVSMSAPVGKHDDCVVALALACWRLAEQSGDFGVEFL